VRPAHGAGGWRWKASRIVVVGGSSRNARKHGLGNFGDLGLAKAKRRRTGWRQGCQRYGGSRSVRKKTPRNQPGATRRSGSGVVNRQVPQSPAFRVQAQDGGARRKPRRDAGNECGASARSRSSGKQKSVERIGLVLRVLSKGRAQEGGSACRKLPVPLTRRAGAHLQNRMSSEGRWNDVLKSNVVLAAE